ncbi:type IX secretion system membrane protein PorP/SprF [Belliella marina]|uniref:Type IX secretion system membrane protein PorP/SprF n=1 Tax=Belliella marina TaxID=1644146 RepID=A0ABW4VQG5_9BACT
MKSIWIIVSLFFMLHSVNAQDMQYSQFYAAPIYLNPAFAGASEMTRIGVNYRNQWPGLGQTLNSYSAYVDHYIFNLNSGIGLIVNGTQESMANLSTMDFGLAYSYRLQLGFDSFLRFGGQASFVSRDANFDNLVFGSQIDPNGNIGDFSGENLGADAKHRFLDYNFGVLYNNKNIWLGISAHHVTQPNVTFIEGEYSKLPMKLSAHGGLKFDLANGLAQNFYNNSQGARELVLAFNYKRQDPFNQLDLGAQLHLQPLVFGLWYRGLPTGNGALPNNESLIGLLGVSLSSGLDIGYSYDYTLSKLGQANTGGAHEISMRFSFLAGDSGQKGRKVTSMPCFKY